MIGLTTGVRIPLVPCDVTAARSSMLGNRCDRISYRRHSRRICGHCGAILRRLRDGRDGDRGLRGERDRILAVTDGNSSNCWPFIHDRNRA